MANIGFALLGPTKGEVTADWRKLPNELHDVYSPPDIIRVMKSRRMRWVGHVAHMGNLREGDHLEDLNVDIRIMIKSVLSNTMGRHELDSSG